MVLSAKLIALSTNVRKEKSKISYLNFHLRKLNSNLKQAKANKQ